MLENSYQICKRCVMDTSDPLITFDTNGYCNHCNAALDFRNRKILSGEKAKNKFNQIINNLKIKGKGKDYDCLIGVSGGVDSTYLAYILVKNGLRPLAVHLDNGWNSELAVSNIRKVLEKLNIEFDTHVLDWEQFKDLQLSFLKASTPDSEIPTDHAIVAVLKKIAIREKIPLILGTNSNTESIMPGSWSQGHGDWLYIKTIQKRFGTKSLKGFPHVSLLQDIWYQHIKKMEFISLLNFIDYDKQKAKEILIKELDWVDYGGKHYESIYTRFFQSYILPVKFGFDKRRAHLASMIISGYATRDEVFTELKSPTYFKDEIKKDIDFIAKKFGITLQEFQELMNKKPIFYENYSPAWNRWTLKNHRRLFNYLLNPLVFLGKVYSKFFIK